jgi:TatD DNase family protein
MLRFVDSHAHIFYEEYRADLDEVLSRASSSGVAGIVCPGTNLETSSEALALAGRYPAVRAAAGFHPHEASRADEAGLAAVEAMSRDPLVVAIGEIGLDYHYDYSPREVQRDVFRRQIGIAKRRRLPVIIHTREAEEDTLAIVEEEVRADPSWRGRERAEPAARGVFHCFPGDAAMAQRVIGLGFYISFPGPLTFPVKPAKPNLMAEVAASAPLDRVLLETDSPYLTPHPHRGTRNEPSRIIVIAGRLAELTGRSLAEISEATNRNVANLFGFTPP